MHPKKRIAVFGLGNVGRGCVEAVRASPDLELVGVVRRKVAPIPELPDVPVVDDVSRLGKVDGALLACPTRQVATVAEPLLEAGIATADSFDLHGAPLLELRSRLHRAAVRGGCASVIAAGWDPGADSQIRAIVEALAPKGITFTNFGPGMSMGHSVAAKAVPGVRDALSLTLPKGEGLHRRMVFVELEEGANAEEVAAAIRADAYFAKDETIVRVVDDVAALADMGHGVRLERKGVSGSTHNQHFAWEMRIQNPALTGQAMTAALRAALRQPPGCYTPLEIPLVDFLPGPREDWLHELM